MSATVEIIPLERLALVLLPVLAVMVIQQRWALPLRPTMHGIARMLAQLLLVGYVLVFLFESDSPLVVCLLLMIE